MNCAGCRNAFAFATLEKKKHDGKGRKNYAQKIQQLLNNIVIVDKKFSMPQFMFLLCKRFSVHFFFGVFSLISTLKFLCIHLHICRMRPTHCCVHFRCNTSTKCNISLQQPNVILQPILYLKTERKKTLNFIQSYVGSTLVFGLFT